MSRRALAVVPLAVLAVGGAGGAAWVLRDEPAASSTGSPETSVATVERQTLKEAETVSGELGYDGALTVSAAGAGVLTKLPEDGTVVRRGGTAYRVDDEPVVLLLGALPLWRTLQEGVDDGADVAQLERNLEALGYDPGTVDESFTSWTREAVEDLQEDRGMEETGAVAADRFLVQPTALRVGAAQASAGQQLQPGAALYAATGTRQVVTIDLDPSEESLATRGARASVTLPNGRTTTATVTTVGTVATGTDTGSETPSAEATIPITLTLDRPRDARGLSASPVTVDLTSAVRRDVLTVPVTALVALAEGGFAVRREDGSLVAVSPGLYADGRVEITRGLAEGDRVVVPS